MLGTNQLVVVNQHVLLRKNVSMVHVKLHAVAVKQETQQGIVYVVHPAAQMKHKTQILVGVLVCPDTKNITVLV